jgi:hypothetical protein
MSERVLAFQGGPTEDDTVRPTISIYFDHDGWSNEQFADALRAGATDEVERESRRALTMGAIHAVVSVDGWEIGRELANDDGALTPRIGRVWRRFGEAGWHFPGQGPSRDQIRRATYEPYRALIDEMLAEGRSLYPDWAEQMAGWPLTRVRSGRGRPREFDSSELNKQSGEDNDSWVADRLRVGGVHWQTPAKRRWRDRRAQLGQTPWAIRVDESTSVEGCRIAEG